MAHCPNCGGELKIIAAIMEQPVIEKILTHLGLQADCGRRSAPARGPAPQEGAAACASPPGSAAPKILRAEVCRLMERENPNATPLRGALRRCDRPSTCGSQTQGPGQWVIESLAEGPLEEKSAFEFPILTS